MEDEYETGRVETPPSSPQFFVMNMLISVPSLKNETGCSQPWGWPKNKEFARRAGGATSGLSAVYPGEQAVEVVVLVCASANLPGVLSLLSVGRIMSAASRELTSW